MPRVLLSSTICSRLELVADQRQVPQAPERPAQLQGHDDPPECPKPSIVVDRTSSRRRQGPTLFEMPVSDQSGPSLHALIVPLAGALLLLVTVLRLAVSNPIEAVGFLYVIPISLLAAERGWRGGLGAAATAIALTIVWAVVQHVPLGVIGYFSRAATFASVGILVGFHAEQRRKLESERELLLDELRATALSDALTGLPNRRAWDERLAHELAVAVRSGCPLSVAAIDLDKLKQGNDSLGHEQGDRLIQDCAQLWAASLRDTDFIARVGGDEFMVVLPDCAEEKAEQIARRVRDATPSKPSFSVGIATWNADEESYELIHRADRAMYAAKAAGGDRISVAPTPPAGRIALVPGRPLRSQRAS
jgi:diguanylate cyclase (GGDEF)-like protein